MPPSSPRSTDAAACISYGVAVRTTPAKPAAKHTRLQRTPPPLMHAVTGNNGRICLSPPLRGSSHGSARSTPLPTPCHSLSSTDTSPKRLPILTALTVYFSPRTGNVSPGCRGNVPLGSAPAAAVLQRDDLSIETGAERQQMTPSVSPRSTRTSGTHRSSWSSNHKVIARLNQRIKLLTVLQAVTLYKP